MTPATPAGDSALRALLERLAAYFCWSGLISILFCSTYAFTNWFASTRTSRSHFFADWELGIPFVPWMIWVYLSLQIYLALPVFVLDRAGISRLGRAFVFVTLAAAAMHLAVPTDAGWQRPSAVAGYPIFEQFYALDKPHNLAPSLHIAYGTLGFLVVWQGTRRIWLRGLAALWLGLLVSSVLLVHQHHLVDIVAGLLLGASAIRWFRPVGTRGCFPGTRA